jgi:hypothetical protein
VDKITWFLLLLVNVKRESGVCGEKRNIIGRDKKKKLESELVSYHSSV